MKRKYISPEMDIMKLDKTDIIITSDLGGKGITFNGDEIDENGNVIWTGWY